MEVIIRKWICLPVTLLWLALATPAQEKSTDPLDQLRQATAAVRAKTPCKNLSTLGAVVDGAFDGQKNETRMISSVVKDPDDGIWDGLRAAIRKTERGRSQEFR